MKENENLTPEEQNDPEKTPYVPRPKWQIVLAWIALIIFITGVVLYYAIIITQY